MSFFGYKKLVEEGDTVVVFLSVLNMQTVVVQRDHVYQSKYGALKWNDVIGRPYGSIVQCTKGWVYILHPTPELWTVNLPHRTQILYTTDISLITLQLDLRPGSVVAEAGTGSGSLSHAMIRTLAPTGHLYSFDFHEERVRRCEEEFKCHGLSDYVSVTQRDVVSDGFGLDHVADAVFLDLPLPWRVVEAAKSALKIQGGRFCSFSPCIEQVQKTCVALRAAGFTCIDTLECLQRPLDVRKATMPVWTPNTCVNKDFKRVKLNEEPMCKEDVVEDAPLESTCSWNEAFGPLKQVTHTGYLTFATLLPPDPTSN